MPQYDVIIKHRADHRTRTSKQIADIEKHLRCDSTDSEVTDGVIVMLYESLDLNDALALAHETLILLGNHTSISLITGAITFDPLVFPQ